MTDKPVSGPCAFTVLNPHELAFRIRIKGRNLWALQQLIEAGERGCTPIDTPAPRWSAYVHNLRRMGVVIDTITESHGGPFGGTHARYVLRSHVIAEEGAQ